MENLARDFKGIWIPKEIYLCKELNWTDKIILLEIDSLDNEDHCFAGNEYFADFLGISVVSVSRSINKLINLGFISVVSFDGRIRTLQSNLNFSLTDMIRQPKTELKGSLKLNDKANNNINNNTPSDIYKYISSPPRKNNPVDKIKIDEVVDYETLFRYWEQNKQGKKYRSDESRQRMLKKLKELTRNNFHLAKKAILHCIDNNYQGFCNGNELFYKPSQEDILDEQIENNKRIEEMKRKRRDEERKKSEQEKKRTEQTKKKNLALVEYIKGCGYLGMLDLINHGEDVYKKTLQDFEKQYKEDENVR
ncbi:MAG: helix-turn-helix domain-containing protein [Clostridium sp.]|nr:helix-turn-helix domain-containing protein [Clostridium sp.]